MTFDSSAYEVLSVVVPSFLLVFIASTSCTIFYGTVGRSTVRRYVFEYIVIVIPIILNITVLVPYMSEILGLLAFISINLIFVAARSTSVTRQQELTQSNGHKNFVTNLRATINLITAIAILAVDFKIFPRQFGKRLKYGYSLMDVGVGLFVFANGLVAPEIRGYRNTVWKTIKDTIPLIVIGMGRYVMTHLTHYSVSVTEYGVHWNFFITLAVTKILSTLILNVVSVRYSILSGVAILTVHETLLQSGLAEYIFSDAERSNFFSANREGIVSSLGFVGLYFLSVSIGVLINIKEKRIPSNSKLFFKMIVCSAVLFSVTFYLEGHFDISRRIANSTYCLWTLAVGVLMLTLFFGSEIVQRYIYENYKFEKTVHVPLILDAINYNGLFYFLIANILTGLVNMACDTLLVGHFRSICILVGYMCLTCVLVCFLYKRQIKLKL